MTTRSDHLIQFISLVNRPNSDKVVARARRAELLPQIIRPLSAAVITYGLAMGLGGLGARSMVPAAIVGVLVALVAFLDDTLPNAVRHQGTLAKVAAGLGLFCGIAISLITAQALWIVIAAGVGGFVGMGGIAYLGISVFTFLISLLNPILRVLAAPIAVPVLAGVAWFNNRAMENSGWTTSNGKPIVVFNRNGIKVVQHANEPIFVSSPRLRAGEAALAAGIPLFTYAEIQNPTLVAQRMGDAYQAAFAPEVAVPVHEEHPLMRFTEVNPATGLPMLDGISSLDVMGNTYGFADQQFHYDSGMYNNGFDQN